MRLTLERAGTKQIRLASKSIRSVGVLRYILDFDPHFRGIMCFTADEAMFLADQGFTDLLIGYPIWDESKLTAIARRAAEGSPITLMVDSLEHVERIERIAQQIGAAVPLCVEIDLSMDFFGLHFGVWRSPLRSVPDTVEIAKRIAASKHVTLDGIMGYEAQIAGVGDSNPSTRMRNILISYLKRKSIHRLTDTRAQLMHELHQLGIKPRFVNGGGTGSLGSTSFEEAVTEVTVGSGFYAPGLFDHYGAFRYEPAAGYAIEIVRRPSAHIYTCLGGGYTASGSMALDKLPKPYLPEGAQLMAMEGAGEVQTPIVYKGPRQLGNGDPIFMRHAKAGELCERFNALHIYESGSPLRTLTTYRGEGQCFL